MRLPSVEDMANPDRLTDQAIKALRRASRLAWERSHQHVAPEHLLMALTEMEPNFAQAVLHRLGVDLSRQSERVSALVTAIRPASEEGRPSPGPALDRLIAAANLAAKSWRQDWVGTEHLLAGMLSGQGEACADFLADRGVTMERLRIAVGESQAGR